MKKTLALLMAFMCLTILFTACNNEVSDYTGTASSSLATDSINRPTHISTTPPDAKLPEYVPGSIKLAPLDEFEFEFSRPYRWAYYSIKGTFLELLSGEERQDYYAWRDAENQRTNYGETQEEMLLVSFIKRYDIPREEFDNAVSRWEEGVSHT